MRIAMLLESLVTVDWENHLHRWKQDRIWLDVFCMKQFHPLDRTLIMKMRSSYPIWMPAHWQSSLS